MYAVLDTSANFLGGLNGYALLFAHCAFCATLAPDVKDRYLMHYWVRISRELRSVKCLPLHERMAPCHPGTFRQRARPPVDTGHCCCINVNHRVCAQGMKLSGLCW